VIKTIAKFTKVLTAEGSYETKKKISRKKSTTDS